MAGYMVLELQTSLKRPCPPRNAHTNSRGCLDANPTPQRPFSLALLEEAYLGLRTHTRGIDRTPNPAQNSIPWICSSLWPLLLGSNRGQRNLKLRVVNCNKKVSVIKTKTNSIGRTSPSFKFNSTTRCCTRTDNLIGKRSISNKR